MTRAALPLRLEHLSSYRVDEMITAMDLFRIFVSCGFRLKINQGISLIREWVSIKKPTFENDVDPISVYILGRIYGRCSKHRPKETTKLIHAALKDKQVFNFVFFFLFVQYLSFPLHMYFFLSCFFLGIGQMPNAYS